MKRFTTWGAALLLVGFILTGCDSSDAVGPEGLSDDIDQASNRPSYEGAGYCGDDDPATLPTGAPTFADYCVDLVAGQTGKVGEVFYGINGDGDFQYEYVLSDGTCISEVHIGVYDDLGLLQDAAVNNGGNVQFGNLTFVDEYGTCQSGPIGGALDGSGLSGDYYVIAHGVTVGGSGTDPNCPIIAGIVNGSSAGGGHGDTWGVNPFSGYSTPLFDYQGPLADATETDNWDNYPNGLALHGDTYYFSTLQGDLFDGTGSDINALRNTTGTGTQVGNLARLDAGATIFGDDYYYIPQSPLGAPWNVGYNDDLRVVDLTSPAGSEAIACPDITGLADRRFEFGDLTVDVVASAAAGFPVLLGSAFDSNSGEYVFFRLSDPGAGNSCTYEEFVTDQDFKVQLAFGNEGTLFAHATRTGNFYTADYDFVAETLTLNLVGTVSSVDGLLNFNDLAPAAGSCFVPGGDEETAIGFGQQTFSDAFNGRRWGWVFQGCVDGGDPAVCAP